MEFDWISQIRNHRPEPKECPDCSSRSIIPIVYGYPGRGMREDAREGRIILGGCMVDESSPSWYCDHCMLSWPVASSVSERGNSQELPLTQMARSVIWFLVLRLRAWRRPSKHEPWIEHYWERPGRRCVFLARFSWGKLRFEKHHLPPPFERIPVYELIAGCIPENIQERCVLDLAKVAAIRFERRRRA